MNAIARAKKPALVVGIGELLWDLLPAGPRLGGTVSNFAVMAGRLGNHAVCASRLGKDELGLRARADLARLPVNISYLQVDPKHPTSTVAVQFKAGQPEYEIKQPVAWDFLELSRDWLSLAESAAAVCFGTLAQRSAPARKTIEGFLGATSDGCVRVFDINLRAPYYSAEVIEESLERTTLLKMNDGEMPVMLRALGLGEGSDTSSAALLAGARQLLAHFPVALVCVTMGAHGSLLVSREETDQHPGVPAEVVDTVGAGDAFTAAVTHYYLLGAPLRMMNEAGNRWGSWVASQAGAMPPLEAATRDAITAAIGSISGS